MWSMKYDGIGLNITPYLSIIIRLFDNKGAKVVTMDIKMTSRWI